MAWFDLDGFLASLPPRGVAEAHLPHREDALGVAVMNTLDGLRMPLRDLLKQRVSSVFEGIEGD